MPRTDLDYSIRLQVTNHRVGHRRVEAREPELVKSRATDIERIGMLPARKQRTELLRVKKNPAVTRAFGLHALIEPAQRFCFTKR